MKRHQLSISVYLGLLSSLVFGAAVPLVAGEVRLSNPQNAVLMAQTRGYDRDMSFEDAVKLVMVSFDSTLKANLSVGLPLDLMVIAKDDFAPTHEHRVTQDDPYLAEISANWGDALRSAFHSLPDYSFESR